MKFIRSRFKTSLITFDLDVESDLQQPLVSSGLVKGRDFLAIGKDVPGRRAIEGLLPESIFQEVQSTNTELVLKLSNGSASEIKSAKSALKKLYLAKLKEKAVPRSDAYREFYKLIKQINKILSEKKTLAQAN